MQAHHLLQGSLQADHEYTLLLQQWLLHEGLTYPAIPMEGAMPNTQGGGGLMMIINVSDQ